MGLRKRFRNFKDWCPQPRRQIPMSFKAFSMPLLASLLIAEVAILLVVPMAYCALLVPKTIVVNGQVLPDRTYPLTHSQIKAAWPNLPTAQEIVNGNYSNGYGIVDSSMPGFDNVKNYTWVSPINAIPRDYPTGVFVTRLIPVENYIYLRLNDTTWIELVNPATNNPPYSLPSPLYYTYTEENGFLGTGLSVEYYVAIIVVILVTAAAGLGYLLHEKRSAKALSE